MFLLGLVSLYASILSIVESKKPRINDKFVYICTSSSQIDPLSFFTICTAYNVEKSPIFLYL